LDIIFKQSPIIFGEMPMPLEFQSISHGKIAFGFFNIETEMKTMIEKSKNPLFDGFILA